jgi:hypothetical protein
MGLVLWSAAIAVCSAQPFALRYTQPTLDRWMYPFNATPGCRPSAPVFATFGDEAGVDTRHGQFLLGFDTIEQTVTHCGLVAELPSLLVTNQGAANYLIRRAQLKVTISRDLAFRYDPTPDAYTTYFESNQAGLTLDADPGRPIELFGVGYRNGFAIETFWEDSPMGPRTAGGRNVYAAGYARNGALVDVSNNVGKTNATFPAFEVYPFAIGQTLTVSPGDLVPIDTVFLFDLNLADPLVKQYLQEALHSGRLRFMITGLHTSEFGGQPTWPDFYTRDSVLGSPATLEIDGSVVSSLDTDADGLPDDWEQFFFGSLDTKASDDPDHDEQSNGDEFASRTDPIDPTSRLRVISIGRNEKSYTRIQFPIASGARYIIEYSQDLMRWSLIANPVLVYDVGAKTAEWQDDGFATGGGALARFYRIRAE